MQGVGRQSSTSNSACSATPIPGSRRSCRRRAWLVSSPQPARRRRRSSHSRRVHRARAEPALVVIALAQKSHYSHNSCQAPIHEPVGHGLSRLATQPPTPVRAPSPPVRRLIRSPRQHHRPNAALRRQTQVFRKRVATVGFGRAPGTEEGRRNNLLAILSDPSRNCGS